MYDGSNTDTKQALRNLTEYNNLMEITVHLYNRLQNVISGSTLKNLASGCNR